MNVHFDVTPTSLYEVLLSCLHLRTRFQLFFLTFSISGESSIDSISSLPLPIQRPTSSSFPFWPVPISSSTCYLLSSFVYEEESQVDLSCWFLHKRISVSSPRVWESVRTIGTSMKKRRSVKVAHVRDKISRKHENLTHLETTKQSFIYTHHCACIVELPTVIRSTEKSD